MKKSIRAIKILLFCSFILSSLTAWANSLNGKIFDDEKINIFCSRVNKNPDLKKLFIDEAAKSIQKELARNKDHGELKNFDPINYVANFDCVSESKKANEKIMKDSLSFGSMTRNCVDPLNETLDVAQKIANFSDCYQRKHLERMKDFLAQKSEEMDADKKEKLTQRIAELERVPEDCTISGKLENGKELSENMNFGEAANYVISNYNYVDQKLNTDIKTCSMTMANPVSCDASTPYTEVLQEKAAVEGLERDKAVSQVVSGIDNTTITQTQATESALRAIQVFDVLLTSVVGPNDPGCTGLACESKETPKEKTPAPPDDSPEKDKDSKEPNSPRVTVPSTPAPDGPGYGGGESTGDLSSSIMAGSSVLGTVGQAYNKTSTTSGSSGKYTGSALRKGYKGESTVSMPSTHLNNINYRPYRGQNETNNNNTSPSGKSRFAQVTGDSSSSFGGVMRGGNLNGGSGLSANGNSNSNASAGSDSRKRDSNSNRAEGSKNIYSSKLVKPNGGSGSYKTNASIFAQQTAAEKKMAALKAQGNVFDPSKYEPNMEAQKRALERAAGRAYIGARNIASEGAWPEDIHRAEKDANLFNYIRATYQKHLED